jgi:acyl homoserine lactone synthase
MIEVVTVENSHLFGAALAEQFKLRYRVFIERQKYSVPTHKDMEYDQFDTPAATYLVYRDPAGRARGITRLLPTTKPYMIQEVWPTLIEDGHLPSAPDIMEATRFGVDTDLDRDEQRRAVTELVCGCLEYGLRYGVREYVSVMPTLIYRKVLMAAGVDVQFLGAPRQIDGFNIVAGRINITAASLAEVRRRSGMHRTVLDVRDDSLALEKAA